MQASRLLTLRQRKRKLAANNADNADQKGDRLDPRLIRVCKCYFASARPKCLSVNRRKMSQSSRVIE